MDVCFSCVCPIIDNEFHHNIVKVMTKFMINNRTIMAEIGFLVSKPSTYENVTVGVLLELLK